MVVKFAPTNHKGEDVSDAVTWDGKFIHDRPSSCEVNDTTKCTDPKKSNLALKKPFPKSQFSRSPITNAYKLVE